MPFFRDGNGELFYGNREIYRDNLDKFFETMDNEPDVKKIVALLCSDDLPEEYFDKFLRLDVSSELHFLLPRLIKSEMLERLKKVVERYQLKASDFEVFTRPLTFPLFVAVLYKKREIIYYLVKVIGVDPNFRAPKEWNFQTALIHVDEKDEDFVLFLVDVGFDVSLPYLQNVHGTNSILNYYSCHSLEMIFKLTNKGVNLTKGTFKNILYSRLLIENSLVNGSGKLLEIKSTSDVHYNGSVLKKSCRTTRRLQLCFDVVKLWM